MDDRPVLPTLRAAVFSAVCVTLAETAHRLMSLGSVPLSATVAALAAVFVAARAAARRERGLASISAVMLLMQAALHMWFNTVQGATGSGNGNGDGAMSATAGCALMPQMSGMDPASMCGDHYRWGLMALLHTGNGMLIAHGVAAFACAWWLRHGEAALFRLVRALMLVLIDVAVAVGVPVVCPPAAVAPRGLRGISPDACTAWRPKRLMVLRYAVARRGPPRVGMAV